jgi:hypothetical protein
MKKHHHLSAGVLVLRRHAQALFARIISSRSFWACLKMRASQTFRKEKESQLVNHHVNESDWSRECHCASLFIFPIESSSQIDMPRSLFKNLCLASCLLNCVRLIIFERVTRFKV